MSPLNEKVLRAGLYERVSTQEQAMKGYSIETQKDNLEEYCNNNNIKIVDHYTDEGISGSKSPLKRPQLKRLLDDVEAGKIDIIIFTKLDRWFRNVPEYFKVQEILDKKGVTWKAIFEDYNTDTADGRLKVNIMLSIAANEREKTGERIKVVREHKIKNKEASFGGKYETLGYLRQRDENGIMRLVKDPQTEEMMTEFWEELIKHEQINKVGKYINNKYGIERVGKLWNDTARKEIYTGEYRGVKDFCEPYVDRQAWEKFMQTRIIKKTQNNRVYLFTGLIKCPLCGRHFSATYNIAHGKEYRRYRCPRQQSGLCDYNRSLSEEKLEQHLIENIQNYARAKIKQEELEQAKPKPKPKTNIAALKEKLRRLNVTYMAGNKPDDEYLREQAEIKALITEAEKSESSSPKDLTSLKEILETNFMGVYQTFSSEEKRRFWRGIIEEIKVERGKVIGVKFFCE